MTRRRGTIPATGLYQDVRGVLPPEDTALRRTVDAWVTSVVRRIFPDAIILEGVTHKEAPMLEETLIKYKEQVRREADEIIRQGLRGVREAARLARLEGRRELLLEQMTQRFGRLPAKVRRQIEEISSIQELRKLGRKVLRAKSLEEMGLG
jgi:hypothetical protein